MATLVILKHPVTIVVTDFILLLYDHVFIICKYTSVFMLRATDKVSFFLLVTALVGFYLYYIIAFSHYFPPFVFMILIT